jgi:hypothetical protein
MNQDSKHQYYFPEQALEKWDRQYLRIEESDDGVLEATFHYYGTTCALSDRPLEFDYHVRLSKEADGYRIAATKVEVEDHYYKAMCGSTTFGRRFKSLVEEDLPLQGELLESVFRWHPEMSPAGCLCLQSHRVHKWRLVFETIHYSIGRRG